jgi:hypothetical protein
MEMSELDSQKKPNPNNVSRNLLLVACHIARLIPEDQVEFKNDIMNYIKSDLVYRDPYALTLSYVWSAFEYSVMKKHIPTLNDANEQWKKDVVDLYTGKTPLSV